MQALVPSLGVVAAQRLWFVNSLNLDLQTAIVMTNIGINSPSSLASSGASDEANAADLEVARPINGPASKLTAGWKVLSGTDVAHLALLYIIIRIKVTWSLSEGKARTYRQ
jgi:hypothetical protein